MSPKPRTAVLCLRSRIMHAEDGLYFVFSIRPHLAAQHGLHDRALVASTSSHGRGGRVRRRTHVEFIHGPGRPVRDTPVDIVPVVHM